MKETIVSFKVAKLAKEKGFDWNCYNMYLPTGELKNILHDKVQSDCTSYYTNKRGNNWDYIEKGHLNDLLEIIKSPNIFVFNCEDDKYCEYSAPSQSLLSKWLREIQNINVIVNFHHKGKYSFNIFENATIFSSSILKNNYFKTYEEAFEEGLLGVLKNLAQ